MHKDIAAEFLPTVVAELERAKVEVRGCPRVLALLPEANLVPAIEEDWSTEYSDLTLSVKIVDTLERGWNTFTGTVRSTSNALLRKIKRSPSVSYRKSTPPAYSTMLLHVLRIATVTASGRRWG